MAGIANLAAFPWLVLVILAPGLGLLALRYRPQPLMRWLWLCSVPALLVSLFPPAPQAFSMLWPDAALAVNDHLSRAWLGFSALLWICATRYAATGMDHDPHRLRFWFFWTAVLTGNYLLVLAQDVITFYTAFTLLSLSSYALIIHQGGPGPARAGRLYLELAVLGEIFISIGLLLRVLEADGTLELSALADHPISPWTAVLLFAGFGIKAGFWPLHVWLPIAHPVAPAAASAVLSGALIKAGLLGIGRFLPGGDPLMQDWSGALLVLGLLGIFYGALVGLVQTQAKVVLAYSSISQMGFLLVVLALFWRQAEGASGLLAAYVVHHGLAKGALFLGAGLALHGRLSRGYWLLLFIPALALAGLPLSSGGAVKSAVKYALAGSVGGIGLMMAAGALGTLLLLFRALWLMRPEAAVPADRPPLGQALPCAVLCLMPVILPLAWPAIRGYLTDHLALDTTWSLLWPMLLAAALTLAVVRYPQRLGPYLDRLAHPVLLRRLKRLVDAHRVDDPWAPSSRWRHWERFLGHLLKLPTVRGTAWLLLALALASWWTF